MIVANHSEKKFRFAKYFVLLITLQFNIEVFPQQNQVDPVNVKFTKIPSSPTASSLTTFAEVPIGLYSGTAQFNIPLYTVQGKNLSVPISLNYSTNGLHVESRSSWVGSGWSLDAGGVITREVRGQADEIRSDAKPKVYTGCLDAIELEKLESISFDTQYDMFNYNFMGHTGSFIIVDQVIKSIDNQDLKFEKSGGINEFIVTDKEGIRYYFGHNYAGQGVVPVETTRAGHDELEHKTAWYLSKIVHWGGETIFFSYGGGAIQPDYHVGYNQNREKFKTIEDNMCDHCFVSSHEWSPVSTIDFSTYRHRSVYLSKIYTSDNIDSVDFSGDTSGLTLMTGKSKNVSFTLLTSGHRKYLKKVKIQSPGGMDVNAEIYKFNYHDENNVPPSNTYGRDYWGYYNGSNPPDLITGNHEPNPEYAKNGSLRQITYPTGGTTQIQYEGNYKIEEKCIIQSSLPEMWSPAAGWHIGAMGGPLLNEPYEFTIPFDQEVTFTLHQEYYPNPAPNVNSFNQGKAYFSYAGQQNFTFEQPTFDNGFRKITRYLPAGTYYFNLAVKSTLYRASFRIDFCAERGPVQVQYGGIRVKSVKMYAGEQKLASHKTFEYMNPTFSSPQRYSTKFISNPNNICDASSTPELNHFIPYCTRLVESNTGPSSSSGSYSAFYGTVIEHFMEDDEVSHSVEHTFNESPMKSYPVAIAMTTIPDNCQTAHYGKPFEIETKYFKRINSEIKVMHRKITMEYSTETLERFYSVVRQWKTAGVKVFLMYNLPSNSCYESTSWYSILIGKLRLGQYAFTSFWHKLENTKTTEYFHNEIGTQTGSVQNETKIFYDNPVHRQVSRTVATVSKKGPGIVVPDVFETTKYFYPDDVLTASSLYGGTMTVGQLAAAQKMNKSNGHMISTPLQIEKFDRDGNRQETNRVTYFLQPLNGVAGSISLPEKTQSLKGDASPDNPMEDGKLFSNYNLTNLKPQLITEKLGLRPTVYLYGYASRYLIAVIQNSAFTTTISNIAEHYKSSMFYDDFEFQDFWQQLNGINEIQFSTYRYSKLVGISQTIDMKGFSTRYFYDNMGRLIQVKDKAGYLLQENEYNYKMTN